MKMIINRNNMIKPCWCNGDNTISMKFSRKTLVLTEYTFFCIQIVFDFVVDDILTYEKEIDNCSICKLKIVKLQC
jgi:hypothetical protein